MRLNKMSKITRKPLKFGENLEAEELRENLEAKELLLQGLEAGKKFDEEVKEKQLERRYFDTACKEA